MNRVLFLTTVLPGAMRSGGEVASSHFINGIRDAGHDVAVVGFARPGYLPLEGEVSAGVRAIETQSARFRASVWLLSALTTGRPYSVEKYVARQYTEVASKILATGCSAVVIDHGQMGWLLPYLSGQRVIHISHNCETQLYSDLAKESSPIGRVVYSREARNLMKVETALAWASSAIWTLTEAQARWFQGVGATTVRTFPIPPIITDSSTCLPSPEFDVGLLGTWTWRPNRLGLTWFLEDVAQQLPNLKIAVAGAGTDDIAKMYPSVRFYGRVPNAVDFLSRARVIAVPSIAGDGIQIKTLDAIAIGRPVVVTPHALRGIDSVPRRVLVADTAAKFSSLVVQALSADRCHVDEWARERRSTFYSCVARALA